MKRFTLFLVFLIAAQFLTAQSIVIDSTFGLNGYIKTALNSPGYNFSSIMDLTPDNHIVITSRTRLNETGLLFNKYTTNGDSVLGYHFLNDLNNYEDISTIKALSDGRFLLTGYEPGKGLKRINQDGTVDQEFGTNGGASVFNIRVEDVLISKDSQILLAGEKLNGNNSELKGGYVFAYDMEGHLDSTFGDQGRFYYHENYVEFFNKMEQQPDGKILLTGCFMADGGSVSNILMRLLPNGIQDSTFGVNGLIAEQISDGGENYGMALQADEKILTCGFDGGLNAVIIIRYLQDGARDASFGINGLVTFPMVNNATDLTVLPDGKILVFCEVPGADNYSALIQLLPDGSLDPYFGNFGVYYNPVPNFSPPMKMKLVDGNKLIVTGSHRFFKNGNSYTYLQLMAFTLDLNVGVVSPQNKPQLLVYPNPVQERFEIKFELEKNEPLTFDLYDLQGKHIQTLVSTTTFEKGNHSVAITLAAGLPAGSYLVTLSNHGKPVTTVRVMKL